MLKRFAKIEEDRPSSSESSNSVLKPEDWKRIEKLLKKTVKNIYNDRAVERWNSCKD